MSIYDFSCKDIHGDLISMERYRGTVLLVVNVASQCGFTPQYQALEALYQLYKDRGFSVLAFPCNQFGAQEPGNKSDILSFCRSKFNVTFPLFAKLDVNGGHADPLFSFLKQEARGLMHTRAIKWNFTKFLVDKEGEIVQRFGPQEDAKTIEKVLKEIL